MHRKWRITLALGLTLAVACSDHADPGPHRPSPLSGTLELAGLLLECAPLAHDSAAAVFGPAGGTLAIGPHRLVIPSGALADTVTITGVVLTATAVNAVHFEPHGLRFASPATVSLAYGNCDLPLMGAVRVARTDDTFAILEYLPSRDEKSTQTVTGVLKHFSNYAVAW